MKPTVLIAGILNTKGPEIRYLAEQVEAAGGAACVMECSLGQEMKEYDWVRFHSSDVLTEINMTPEQLAQLKRGPACEAMIEAGTKLVRRLVKNGEIHGIIGYAGGVGMTIVSTIMRELPVGFPKLMCSTAVGVKANASFGTKDLCMMFPVFEAGLNKVSRRIITNAAYGIVGMAIGSMAELGVEERPGVAMMMQGVTTPCTLRCAAALEEAGYDIMLGHATGDGGHAIEDLIAQGEIAGFMDLTTHEMISEIYDFISNPGPDRMRNATQAGIPQVISTGGLELLMFVGRPLTPELEREMAEKVPGRGSYVHAPDAMLHITGCSKAEAKVLGGIFGERISSATAPVSVLIPMRGWDSADCVTDEGDSPLWIPSDRDPLRSGRSDAFLEGLLATVDTNNLWIEIYEVDYNLNDPEFSDLAIELMKDMLNGKWVRFGMSDRDGVTRVI